jgi:hypothetical protein
MTKEVIPLKITCMKLTKFGEQCVAHYAQLQNATSDRNLNQLTLIFWVVMSCRLHVNTSVLE